jgi:phosphatidylserine/phosphatidylglycerophosphate/cardiolipin synthase-like enzyme
MHFCNVKDPYNACVATGPGSFMHSKLMLISQTRDRDGNPQSWVSWFGSANFSPGSGASMYNNTITIYNDRNLYDAFNQNIYRYLWSEQHFPNDDFLRQADRRGYASSTVSNIQAFASPSATHDIIIDNLSKIIPDSTCRIEVGQISFQDSRLNVARKLAELKRRGCRVRAVLGSVPKAIGPQALAILRQARIPIRFNRTHDKNFLVDAKYGASPNKNLGIVFTGSHNVNLAANSNLDELFVKIVNEPLHTEFLAAWQRQWDSGSSSTPTLQLRAGTQEPVDGKTDWEEYFDSRS